MKLTSINALEIQHIHGPQPKNPLGAYFPENEVSICKRDVFRVLAHFKTEDIRYLIKELQAGRINGSFSETDLIGTLTRLPKGRRSEKRLDLYVKIGRLPFLLNDDGSVRNHFEYWFRQIAGDKTIGRFEQIRNSRNRRRATRRSIRRISADSKMLKLLDKEQAEENRDGYICLFTQITVGWCNEFIRKRKNAHSQQRNGRTDAKG